MPCNDQAVNHMPQMMEGTPLRTSAAKRIHQLSREPPYSDRIDAAQDANRHAQQGRPGQSSSNGAHDGVGHAAAGFADGFGQLGEKVPIQRAEART